MKRLFSNDLQNMGNSLSFSESVRRAMGFINGIERQPSSKSTESRCALLAAQCQSLSTELKAAHARTRALEDVLRSPSNSLAIPFFCS